MVQFVNNYSSYINSKLEDLKNRSKDQKISSYPFITISRETGAYGVTISKGLSDYIKKKQKKGNHPWTVFDKNLVKFISEEHDLLGTISPYLNESEKSFLQNIIQETHGLNLSNHAIVMKNSINILHLAQLGHVILVGMASNVITSKLPGGIHIRLISPFDDRVEHIGEYYPMSEKEAQAYIYTEEGNRKSYVKKYFDKDIEDSHEYDLVINVNKLHPEEIIKLIGDLVIHHFKIS